MAHEPHVAPQTPSSRGSPGSPGLRWWLDPLAHLAHLAHLAQVVAQTPGSRGSPGSGGGSTPWLTWLTWLTWAHVSVMGSPPPPPLCSLGLYDDPGPCGRTRLFGYGYTRSKALSRAHRRLPALRGWSTSCTYRFCICYAARKMVNFVSSCKVAPLPPPTADRHLVHGAKTKEPRCVHEKRNAKRLPACTQHVLASSRQWLCRRGGVGITGAGLETR